MSNELDLNPDYLSHSFFTTDAEGSVEQNLRQRLTGQYVGVLHERVVTAAPVDHASLVEEVSDRAESFIESVCDDPFPNYAARLDDTMYTFFTGKIEDQLNGKELSLHDDIQLSDQAVGALRDSVMPLAPADIDRLNGMLDVWGQHTAFPELVGSLNDIRIANQPSRHVDSFRLIDNAREDLDAFALPVDRGADLEWLSYLPQEVRTVARGVALSAYKSNLYDSLEPSLATDEPISQLFIDEVHRPHDWSRLAATTGIDLTEGVVGELATQSIETAEIIAEVDRIVGKKRFAKNVKENTQNKLEQMRQDVYGLHKLFPDDDLAAWRAIDMGHCIGADIVPASLDWSSIGFAGERRGYSTYHKPKKNGRKAVIFEDDPVQGDRYTRLLRDHSPWRPDKVQERPAGVVEKIRDPKIGLFVLDIQNPAGEFAGVDLATAIIDERRDWPLEHSTNVHVHTLSETTFRTASRAIMDYLIDHGLTDEFNRKSGHFLNTNNMGENRALDVKVELKSAVGAHSFRD